MNDTSPHRQDPARPVTGFTVILANGGEATMPIEGWLDQTLVRRFLFHASGGVEMPMFTDDEWHDIVMGLLAAADEVTA